MAQPEKLKPLIISINDGDVFIKKFHHNQILNGDPESEIEWTDKSSYCSWMDKINQGIYPYLIVIILSNSSKKEIDSLDPAYLRSGRINYIAHVENPSYMDTLTC